VSTATAKHVSLATLNVRWGLRTTGGDIDLVSCVRSLRAEVVLLQELWASPGAPRALDDAAAELGYTAVELPLTHFGVRQTRGFAKHRGQETGRWGLAVLSRLPVVDVHSIPLGRAHGDDVSRAALAVSHSLDGCPFMVITTHLTHHAAFAPLQLRRLARAIAAYEPPLVIAGDLNCVGTLASPLLPRLRRAVRARTWPARRPLVQLDHVFTSRCVAVCDARALPDIGSDHLPLRVELAIPKTD
jgi:endonuclease/exonuclease/phosphatase family metal-dependent hydrolase